MLFRFLGAIFLYFLPDNFRERCISIFSFFLHIPDQNHDFTFVKSADVFRPVIKPAFALDSKNKTLLGVSVDLQYNYSVKYRRGLIL